MYVRFACMLTALVVAGCANELGTLGAAAPIHGDATPSSDPTDSGSVVLERGGRLLYRLGADQPPFTRYEGDAPTFCFDLGANATQIEATFTFDVKQPMWLQLNEPARSGEAHYVDGTSDLTLSTDDPPEGQWFAYSGPSAAGGATEWRLVLKAHGPNVDLRVSDEPCW